LHYLPEVGTIILFSPTPERNKEQSMSAGNITSIVSVRETPWHGLGVVPDHDLNALQARVLGGLDWTVELHPSYAKVGEEFIPNHGAFNVVRMDEKRILGTVTKRYKPLQNEEAFNLAEAITGIQNESLFETAGTFDNGQRVWILMRLPNITKIAGDEISRYILLLNHHDGKGSFICVITPVRVVCQNTLTAALQGAKNTFRVKHIGNQMDTNTLVLAARDVLKISGDYFTKFEDVMNGLLKKPVTTKEIEFVRDQILLPLPEMSIGKRKETEIEKGRNLFNKALNAADIANVRDTAYGLWNATVDYLDHDRATNQTKDNPNGALERKYIRTFDEPLKDEVLKYLVEV